MHQLTIQSMDNQSIQKVSEIEKVVLLGPQVDIATTHTLHDGVYTRTIKIPAGVVLTGAIIKIPTTLIISGDVLVYIGNETKHLQGYVVLAANKNRKQVFVANSDTHVTMIFKTSVNTIEEAERQFTDDFDSLMSRKKSALNYLSVSGE